MKRFQSLFISLLLVMLSACGGKSENSPPIVISASTMDDAVVGTAYNMTLGASGGDGTYTWSIDSGALASGLTLSKSGAISGTPTNTGSYAFTVKVTDTSSPTKSASQPLTLTVQAQAAQSPPVAIATATLSAATVASMYSAGVAASGGMGPYTWALATGSTLPAGLNLTGSTISGTPTTAGNYNFTIKVTDASTPPKSATQALALTVQAQAAQSTPVAITTTTLSAATVASMYSAGVAASGGMGPYTWALATGSTLPAGLNLTGSTISGTPTTAGNYNFTIKVTDASTPPKSATQALALTVQPQAAPGAPVKITPIAQNTFSEGMALSVGLSASGGKLPYAWSIDPGSALPSFLALDSGTGKITNTTTTLKGTYNFTIKVADASSPMQTASLPISLVVSAAAPPPPPPAGNAATGQALYTTNCQGCHSAPTSGSSPYKLAGPDTAANIALLQAACAGAGKKMNCGGVVSAANLADVVAYIQSVNASTPPPAPGGSNPGTGTPPPQTVLPPLDPGSAELPLRRLTRTQFINTLQDIAKQTLPGAEGDAIASAVPAAASTYPVDSIVALPGQRHGGFQRLDQAVQQGHIDAGYELAARLAQELTQANRMTALMGTCATDSVATNDATCLNDFVKRFGRLAFRRPLTDAEVSFHAKLAGSTPVARDAVADVLTLLLSAPQVSYMVEHGQAGAASGRISLTAHELAARMSYHFWQAPPDKELAALADNAKLLDPATYRAQVDRLSADARADNTVREFFAQWFRLQEMEGLDSRLGDKLFDAFRGSFTPNANTKQNAINEITDLSTYLIRNNGNLQALLSDKRSFAKTPDIAALYGMPVWDGNSAPAAFADATRSGLLSRIAFLATGSANTRPIIKGYRIRSALLCQSLPPPPAEAAMFTVDLSPSLTTRQVVEQVTEKPGTACVSCHGQINPLGFASENFDSLGRSRSAQRMFDAQGQLLGELAVRTDSTPKVTSADSRTASDMHQVTQYILQSGEFERCFAQHYFRFTFARGEREGDRDAITEVMNAARTGATMRDLLARYALRPEFQTKVF